MLGLGDVHDESVAGPRPSEDLLRPRNENFACGLKNFACEMFSLPSLRCSLCPAKRARPARPHENRRRFQSCIERLQSLRRLFLGLCNSHAAPRQPRLRVPDLVDSRFPSPYHFRARIQSFQGVAAPFLGDSVFPAASRAATPATAAWELLRFACPPLNY